MWQNLAFVYHLLKFSKDVRNTAEVFKFSDSLIRGASRADRTELGNDLIADPAARQLYASGNADYLYKPFDLVALRRCAPGTLGHAYAAMMDRDGLDPEFFAYNKVEDVASFFVLRLRKTHDLHHLVVGFDTTEVGELGLQGFYLGQLYAGIPLAIATSVFLWTVAQRDRKLIKAMLEEFVFGYQAGKAAVPLHGVVWEELWDTDLRSIRASLRLTRRSVREVA